MCRALYFEGCVHMDWFLRTLLDTISKYVSSHFHQTEEEALQIALKYDLIYDQLGYVYTILPDIPWPSVSNTPREYHVNDGIVGSISLPQPLPYLQPAMSYSQPQGQTSSTYTYPPLNPSCVNSYQCRSTSYAFHHLHQLMPIPIVAQLGYQNVDMTSYYAYTAPNTRAPPGQAPQPPLPQQQPPPQNQVYAYQSTTNPPNPKGRNNGKGNQNQQPQSNQFNQDQQINSPKGDYPNPTTQQHGEHHM